MVQKLTQDTDGLWQWEDGPKFEDRQTAVWYGQAKQRIKALEELADLEAGRRKTTEDLEKLKRMRECHTKQSDNS
jgi:hypothetical protein